LDGLDGWRAVTAPDLDIVCWHRDLPTASAVSAAADADFDALARAGWHVAKLRVDPAMLGVEADLTTATVLRATLMKPVHTAMVEPLAEALAAL
ncbi:MAG: hypothetical protein ACKO7Q_00460, partial [Actinomycetota bacterium]